MNIDTYWQRTYELLKNCGFMPLQQDSDSADWNEPPAFNIEFKAEDIVLIEKEINRNAFCIVLCPDESFDVYVQDDIGCGFLEIPLRWADIEYEWLNYLCKGIRGKGFAWKPIDIGIPNMDNNPYGEEFSRTTLY